MTALHKVETPLMERYTTTCHSCGWERQFFGTAEEARESALTMGWEFRHKHYLEAGRLVPGDASAYHAVKSSQTYEVAYCPHCTRLLIGERDG